jgi:poly-gamma-glutamate capsule biosynthesis protein CapA/YwtB (metallophosphatase superfamily)
MTRNFLKLVFLLSCTIASAAVPAKDSPGANERIPLGIAIEDFDTGSIILTSYPGEDQQPTGWSLDSITTHHGSPFALRLSGNTWKVESIPPALLDSGDVWGVSAFIQQTGEIQGFGVRDSAHDLFFSFAGTEQLDPLVWVTVYQGAFTTGTWNDYRLPIADEWLSRFGYLPTITGIVFINDRDVDPTSIVLFDDIEDVSADLPSAPGVSITYAPGGVYRSSAGILSVDVQFTSHVVDPDSGSHSFFWQFGDDSSSTEPNPLHTFMVNDDHGYRVLLEVTDTSGLHGHASCVVAVDPGPTSFPISMNFVGDVMLARNYEAPGGIIPTRGVNAIFAPTRSVLGDSADITVANLECPLTQTGTPHPTKPIVFRGSPANAAGLEYAGIDVVTLANNHIIDYGLAGLRETQSTLRQRGILFSGAGGSSTEAYEPLFLCRSGLTFGFLAFSDRTGQYSNYQPYLDAGQNKPGFANLTSFELIRRIGGIRSDVDVVIVEMHSGVEYSTEPGLSAATAGGDEEYSAAARGPTEADREIRRGALDAGADLVVCHHPHITQGFEVYHGRLIAHSLGNFTFDLSYAETFPSVILRAEIGAGGISGYTVTPVYIDDYIPMRAQGELGLYILDDLAMKSRELGTTLIVNRTAVTGIVVLDSLALTPHNVSHTITVPLHQSGSTWISLPLRLPRNGSLLNVSGVTPSAAWTVRTGRELIWMGNFEDEGCSLWDLESDDEQPDTTSRHGGRRALRHRRASGTATLVTSLEKRLKTGGGVAFSLCGWISTSTARNATAGVKFYDTRTAFSEIGSGDIGSVVSGTTPWTFLANDINAPAGTAFLDVELRSAGPTAGTGYAWFDDIGVVEWSGWQPLGQAVPAPNDLYWIQAKSTTPVASASITFEEQQYVDTHAPARITVPVTAGWNMISNPVTLPDSLCRVRSLFPNSVFEYAFSFSTGSGYLQSSLLANGEGFWAKFPGAEIVTITGTPRLDDSVAVVRGWNMVGSVSTPVDTSSIRTVPAGLLTSLVYGYGSGYFPAEQLLPGSAYWVKCRDAGLLLLSGSVPVTARAGERKTSSTLLSLEFRDAGGNARTLLVRPREDSPERFEMPPQPPEGVFDVRFSSGYMAVFATADSSASKPVIVTGGIYPLMLSWKVHDGGLHAGLKVGKTWTRVEGSGSVRVSDPGDVLTLFLEGGGGNFPEEFLLEQNYPNPFNPSTMLRYAVPVKSDVFIGVYSITGQLVRTLHTGEQLPGFHEAVWNGLNEAGLRVSSGIYFARLVAGSFHQVRKVVLVR